MTSTDVMHKCSGPCGRTLPWTIEFFYVARTNKSGLRGDCKQCCILREAQRYASDSESYRARSRINHEARMRDMHKLLGSRVSDARKRAKRKGQDFDIDKEWVWSLYDLQQGRCALTGHVLEAVVDGQRRGKEYRHPFSPSLDRIDSAEGYTKDNTRLVCTDVNIALGIWGETHLRHMCRAYLSKWDRQHPAEAREETEVLRISEQQQQQEEEETKSGRDKGTVES